MENAILTTQTFKNKNLQTAKEPLNPCILQSIFAAHVCIYYIAYSHFHKRRDLILLCLLVSRLLGLWGCD